MNLVRNTLAAGLLSLSLSAAADLADVPSGEYALETTHGYITFTYSHLGFSTPHVAFDSFDVALTLDNKQPEKSVINVTIDAASIDSRVAKLDEHFNDAKFFDTAKYPTITFKSTSIKADDDDKDEFDIMGDLTIKGVTKPVKLEAEIQKAANNPMTKTPTIGVVAEATLSRSEWGLAEYVPNVGDEITIYISVELAKKN
jgi:polyisoprenoid-binding protein YceI